ncbi:hypothetical protein [Butyrivibrio fibrisolvens]|uniref:hypothetical protein n=1 Tax=Butyrivibrio fibrisolvens TaxID=831 RepID=UPI0020BDB977|nr:hypothetical protein [Butyrivibrio fibrisolvens]
MSDTITNGSYYYTQSAFVQSIHYYSNQTFGKDNFQSAVIDKNDGTLELKEAVIDDKSAQKGYTRVVTANVWNSEFGASQLDDGRTAYSYQGIMHQFQTITYQSSRDIDASELVDTKTTEAESEEYLGELLVTPLHGIGSIPVGENNNYVMTASEVIKPGSEDKIVRVHVHDQVIDVNVDEVDPKNATVIEMFAFCQYADAHGTGTSDKFGSFHSMKSVVDPFGQNIYASIDEAVTKKQDWHNAISSSKIAFTKVMTNETIDASVVLKMLEDTRNLFISQQRDKDLWELTDEEWEKLLDSTDKEIEAAKEFADDKVEELVKERESDLNGL